MITSKLLKAHHQLLHVFTDRGGGVSAAPFDTMNLAFHVGDDDRNVMENHVRLAQALGFEPDRLVHMRQIHSDRIVRCTPETHFRTPPECDALITDIPLQPLMVMVADCTPVLLFDPRRRAVAAVHAGRAGALLDITGKTLAAMRAHFGTDPADVLAVLGPSIHGCCYGVNDTIAGQVETSGYGDSLQRRGGRPCLDVNTILLDQLAKSGVRAEHIETVGICTSCEQARFFSYRAHLARTGRQAGVIMLK